MTLVLVVLALFLTSSLAVPHMRILYAIPMGEAEERAMVAVKRRDSYLDPLAGNVMGKRNGFDSLGGETIGKRMGMLVYGGRPWMSWVMDNASLWHNATNTGRYYPLWFELPLWLLVIGLSLETILGNALVVMAYNLDRGIQKHFSNQYIVSLAISDMIIGLEGFPLLTIYVVHGEKWTLGATVCQIWLFLDYAMCLVSILTVLLITVDRYGSVCYPARYLKWQSPQKVKIMIAASWVIPCLLFGPMIFGWTALTGETVTEPDKCYAPFLNDPYVNMSMYIVYYWTTLVAMLILYRGIHKTARCLERKAQAREKQHLALMIGQTCFAKVGLGLMMHEKPDVEICHDGNTVVLDAVNVDSGYTTARLTSPGDGGLTIADISELPKDSISNKSTPCSITPTIHQTMSAGHRRKMQMNAQESITSMDVYDDNSSLLSRGFGDLSLTSLLTLTHDKHKDLSRMDSGQSLVRVHRRRSTLRRRGSAMSSPVQSSPVHMNGGVTNVSSHVVDNLVVDTAQMEFMSSIQSCLPAESHVAEAVKRESIVVVKDVPLTNVQPMGSKFKSWRMATFKRKKTTVHTKRHSLDSIDDMSLSSDDEDEDDVDLPSPDNKLTTIVEDQSYHTHSHKQETSVRAVTPEVMQITVAHTPSNHDKECSTGANPLKRRRNALSVFLDTTSNLMKRRRKKNKAERKARKAFRTITIIVGFFALFWSPYYITATIYGFCPDCVPSAIFLISYYMCYLNSSGNPFAYALANRQFRVAFLRMLRGDFAPHNR